MSTADRSSISPSEVEEWKRKIDAMTQVECARMQRFSKPGENPVFTNDELWDYFQAHFRSVGGMNPVVSKLIGW